MLNPLTKTEAQIIKFAAGGNALFLGAREKKTLLAMMEEIPALKAEHQKGNCVRVFFDSKIYMGKEPETYLTPAQIKGKY